MPKYKIVGLTGTRGVGKDTLFNLLKKNDANLVRFAFADKLKSDLFTLVFTQFKYDMNTLTPEQKEVVRHLLIGYGMSWRAADPLHWVKEVDAQVQLLNENQIAVITDFRFENEVKYFRDKYGSDFLLINMHRDGAPEPTDEEKKHYKAVEQMANYQFKWGGDTPQMQKNIAGALYFYIVNPVENQK